MLSGIGPAAQLAFHDIPPLVDLPGVGEHLMDHPVIDMNILDKSGYNFGWMLKRKGLNFRTTSAILQWSLFGTGPLTTNVSRRIVLMRHWDSWVTYSPFRSRRGWHSSARMTPKYSRLLKWYLSQKTQRLVPSAQT